MSYADQQGTTDTLTLNHKSLFANRESMDTFVQINHDRLLNHPMYASKYDDFESLPVVGSSIKHTRFAFHASAQHTKPKPSVPTGSKAKASLQTSFPTLDWKAIAEQMKLLNVVQRNAHLITMINSFCDTFNDIILKCNPINNTKVDIRILSQLVEQMYHYADNMSTASPPLLRQKLLESHSIYKLQECMRAICNAIAKHDQVGVTAKLDFAKRWSVREQLGAVNLILLDVLANGRSPWASGIEEVVHYFL
jgi:hypothetical protein